jgi:hypothetical protein
MGSYVSPINFSDNMVRWGYWIMCAANYKCHGLIPTLVMLCEVMNS